jgi:hypothetical protein
VVISQAHQAAGLPSPTASSLVSRTRAGIRRTLGTAQNGKAPALVDDLKHMLDKLPNTRVGVRDRALRCSASPVRSDARNWFRWT